MIKNKKTKVLHVITGLGRGGAERALSNLLLNGLNSRVNSAVVSLTTIGAYGKELTAAGIPVFELRLNDKFSCIGKILSFHRFLKNFSPKIIHGWMYHGNLAALIFARLIPCRTTPLWNVRHCLYDISDEKPLTRLIIRINRIFSKRPVFVVYNSILSRTHHERFGFESGNGLVIPNGFDFDVFQPDDSLRTETRIKLGITPHEIVVGHVARFHPLKDHESFLKAAVQIARSRNDVRFLMVGREVALENHAIRSLIPEALSARFICLGERSDIPNLMQAMDVFCQSSKSEAFPNVLGEAMASGIPCVATDVGDSSEIIGETGVLTAPERPDFLAEALLQMLMLDTQERKHLGVLARERIQSKYALQAIVSRYGDLYESIPTDGIK